MLNPPTTNTATSSYTVAGVDPTNATTGLITKAQLVSGTWFSSSPADEVLVNTAYASTKNLKVGGTLTINTKSYKIVGLVPPTLTGNVSDIYFPLSTMQTLASAPGYVNEVLVVGEELLGRACGHQGDQGRAPRRHGAHLEVARRPGDRLSDNAHKLANDLGGALAIVVLLAAFLIAGLLTLSSVAKRVREIGSLRAIGWTRGRGRPPDHGRDDRHRHRRRLDRGRDRGRGLRGRSPPSGPGSRSPRPGSRSVPRQLSGLVGQSTTGTVTIDRAPHGAGALHDDPDRVRRCARRRPHRRRRRRLARGTTRTGIGAAGPRLMAEIRHEVSERTTRR